MAYRAIFWKSLPGVDPMEGFPKSKPLGEAIRHAVFMEKRHSPLLEVFDTESFLREVATEFPTSKRYENTKIEWHDEHDITAFIVSAGPQYVELCSFDAEEEIVARVFEIADKFGCTHYDQGN